MKWIVDLNIFVLDRDPVIAARFQCDRHVVKMILESAQMLCAAFPQDEAPYRRTHYNHPCTIWARSSRANYEWLITHALELCKEHTFRYQPKRPHKSLDVIRWCQKNYKDLNLFDIGLTTFAQAMPDECKKPDVVDAYRNYYVKHKSTFKDGRAAKWTRRTVPSWFKNTAEESLLSVG